MHSIIQNAGIALTRDCVALCVRILKPVISEGMATITYNCAIYEVSFQEHLRKHGRNELQAKMSRRSQNMSWEAQTQWPQQRHSV